jgi:hypothetical protein
VLFGWRLELHLNFSELCLKLSPADLRAHPHLPEGAAGGHDVAGSAPQDHTSSQYQSHLYRLQPVLPGWAYKLDSRLPPPTHHPCTYLHATPIRDVKSSTYVSMHHRALTSHAVVPRQRRAPYPACGRADKPTPCTSSKQARATRVLPITYMSTKSTSTSR